MIAGAGFTAYKSKMETSLEALKDTGGLRKFDPITIITILSTIVPLLLEMCKKPTPKALRRKFLNRGRLAVAIYSRCQDDHVLKTDGEEVSFADAFELSDAQFDVAKEASDDECEAFIADCVSE